MNDMSPRKNMSILPLCLLLRSTKEQRNIALQRENLAFLFYGMIIHENLAKSGTAIYTDGPVVWKVDIA